MSLKPLSGSSKIVIYNNEVNLQDNSSAQVTQGVSVNDILALGSGGGDGFPAKDNVTANGTTIASTAELSYKVNIISATASDYAVRLPEPQLGGIVGVVNSSSVPVYVFPYDADDSLVGLAAGEPYIVPADGQLYNITCVQNPSVGVWSVSTPTSNNSIRKTVSVNLTADGTVTSGDYSYSAPLLNSNKTTYYPSTGAYDVLNAPLAANDWFPPPPPTTYNKVRLANITVKTNNRNSKKVIVKKKCLE